MNMGFEFACHFGQGKKNLALKSLLFIQPRALESTSTSFKSIYRQYPIEIPLVVGKAYIQTNYQPVLSRY